MNNDTIVAIATAMSNSGIGIIRISGEKSINILEKIFKPKNKNIDVKNIKSYNAHYGFIVDENEVVDECIVLFMKAPNTYTKEDIVEIDCHGGVILMKKVLEIVIKNGARIAEPGEFTKRAFLNGRIDLSQAEAVMDVISAKNDFAVKSSFKQLRGSVLNAIKKLREDIIYNIAFIESALDDPEHYEQELVDYKDKLWITIENLIKKVDSLLKSSDNGRILKEGIKTVIIGKPNAGKSSLLNVLIGEERAIVTEIAGTTRDTLEENININGISLNIIDTAGIRDTDDFVEKIGVNKAKNMIEEADLILYVVDASTELDENDETIMNLINDKKVIILLNKIDLNVVADKEFIRSKLNKDIVSISAKEEQGFDEFYDVLNNLFFDGNLSFNDEVYITNLRHKEALRNARNSLLMVKNSIENDMPEDFYSIDLMESYKQLGSIIGESVEEDLVNEIFSKFCMGK